MTHAPAKKLKGPDLGISPVADIALAHDMAAMFRLLGDANRLRIVAACLDGPISVGRLAERLDISQSLTSHHLRHLKAARLIRAERRGKFVDYQVHDHHVRDILEAMIEHMSEPGARQ